MSTKINEFSIYFSKSIDIESEKKIKELSGKRAYNLIFINKKDLDESYEFLLKIKDYKQLSLKRFLSKNETKLNLTKI